MGNYDSLRLHWLAHLTQAGEYGRLSARERRLLESGSLAVLRASQLESIVRRRRLSAGLSVAAGVALFLGALGAMLALLRPAWLGELSISSVSAGFGVAAVALVATTLFGLQRTGSRAREQVYLELDTYSQHY